MKITFNYYTPKLYTHFKAADAQQEHRNFEKQHREFEDDITKINLKSVLSNLKLISLNNRHVSSILMLKI